MTILLTNDDGIDAPGINALSSIFAAHHEVIMVAPDSNRSASAHSISIVNDIVVQKRTDKPCLAYALSGTPADCVKVASLYLLKDKKIDLVISGINDGPNLGSDVMYSGTVSAAFEGAYLGYKSIAISLSDWSKDRKAYDKAAAYLLENLDKFLKFELPDSTIFNVNYPVHTECIGTVVTKAGVNIYDDAYYEAEEGRIRIKGMPIKHTQNDFDCDVERSREGYVTISPLTMDRNNYDALERLKEMKLF